MGIFGRGNKETGSKGAEATDAGRGQGSGSDEASAPSRPAVSRSRGPFDRSEVDGPEGRLDLGALWLTGTPGMELRLEVDQESESVVGITAVLGESAVQLQAFAAPRSEGIWDDIRTEIAASITSQGGTADHTSGPLGTELQARMPGQSPDGRTVFSPARFVGVDGPRWFLRAVLTGQAAIDEDAASALFDVVRTTVVVRGDHAMAPRELLELKLPVNLEQDGLEDLDGHEEQEDLADQDGADQEGPAARSMDDLKPFERGPEITEIH